MAVILIVNYVPYVIKNDWVISETWESTNSVVQNDETSTKILFNSANKSASLSKDTNSLNLTLGVPSNKDSTTKFFNVVRGIVKTLASTGVGKVIKNEIDKGLNALPSKHPLVAKSFGIVNQLIGNEYYGIRNYAINCMFQHVSETYDRATDLYTINISLAIRNFQFSNGSGSVSDPNQAFVNSQTKIIR